MPQVGIPAAEQRLLFAPRGEFVALERAADGGGGLACTLRTLGVHDLSVVLADSMKELLTKQLVSGQNDCFEELEEYLGQLGQTELDGTWGGW